MNFKYYFNNIIVKPTIQIRESEVADRFTFLKMGKWSFELYLNSISDIAKTGGFRGSTSGNLSLTSISFSTGFSSGLENIIF